MTFGERIALRRKELNMSQVELAKKLKTTKQTIGKYEHDIINDPPLSRVKEFAKALDCDAEFLTGWEKEELSEENEFGNLSEEEIKLILKFRKLNHDNQCNVIERAETLLDVQKKESAESLSFVG